MHGRDSGFESWLEPEFLAPVTFALCIPTLLSCKSAFQNLVAYLQVSLIYKVMLCIAWNETKITVI